jgi:chemotaxis protein histidine kinase CheA
MSRQFGTNITNGEALTQKAGLKSLIYSFSDLHPSPRDDSSPLSEYLMDANQSPSGGPDIKFDIIVWNGPNPPVSRETVVTRTLPRSTFDEIVIAAGDAIEKCTTVTAAPIEFMSSLLAKKAVAELKRKNNRVEFLVPNQDGLTIFYGKVDEIVDRMQMLEERQKMLKAVEEDEARLEAERAKAKAEEEARMEAAARAKAKAEEEARLEAERAKKEARLEATARAKAKAEEEARMEAAARAKAKAEVARVEARIRAEEAKAEEEARIEAARAKAKAEEAWIEAERVKGEEARVDAERIRAFIVSQMTFLCLCQDDSCNDDHPMENGELKRA